MREPTDNNEELIRVGALLASAADRAILDIVTRLATSITETHMALYSAQVLAERQRAEAAFQTRVANEKMMAAPPAAAREDRA